MTLYRKILQATNEINPEIPLRPFLPLTANPLIVESIDNVAELKHFIRIGFRKETGDRDKSLKEAMQTLKQLYQVGEKLKFFRLADDDKVIHDTSDSSESMKSHGDEWTRKEIDQVEWLPAVDESHSSPLTDPEYTILPLFPLSGPSYNPSGPLPRFSSLSDVPTPGTEISLNIFEPRYRKMYNDIISSGLRKFAVPFAHPTIPGKFAAYALLYEIMQIKEVSDETNGQIQYVCNHLVTKPVKMKAIINPDAWVTKESYLKINGVIMDEDLISSEQLDPLIAVVSKWNSQGDQPLARRLLEGLKIDGIWGFVSVWNSHVQQELLQMQVGIAAEVKLRSMLLSDDVSVLAVQAPHRERLLSLHLDVSLLVPTLLQLDNAGKTKHLVGIVEKERKRLNNLAILDKILD